MTIVSAFNVGVSPVVVGDLLLSGPERSEQSTGIPVVGDITQVFPVGSGWSIVGLRQKVNLVAPNCVIAWAGSQLGASIVIKELRSMASCRPLCFNDLAKYFTTLDPDVVKLGVSFVGWISDEKGFRRFNFDALIGSAPCFGEFAVAGTGAQAFSEIAAMLPKDISSPDRNVTSLEKAVSTSLMGTGLMLQSELLTQQNLLLYFGGGYEIATFIKNCFSKIGDITFVFWVADITEHEVQLSMPQLALKQDYLDDILLIRAIRIRPPQNESEPPKTDESLHAVSPVYRNIKQTELSSIATPAMNSLFTCHCILVRSSGPPQVLVRIEYRENRLPESVRFTDGSEHILFSVNQNFVQGLVQSIQRQYRPNPAVQGTPRDKATQRP